MTPPPLPTLHEAFEAHRTTRPTALAVRTPETALDYGGLGDLVDAVTTALAASGVGRGHRVAYLGRESERYYALWLALARLGAVLVPVNRRLALDEVRHILDDSGASLAFVDPDHPLHGPADDIVGLDVGGFGSFLARGAGRPVPASSPGDPETPVAQLYTSGTTGLPKGVVLAHRSFFAVLRSLRNAGLDWIDVGPDDACLVGIPGFHIGGLWFAAQAVEAGAAIVSLPQFDPRDAHALIAGGHVTTAIFVPSMLRSMLALPGVRAEDFATLRKVVYGGSPISDTLLERCLAVLRCDMAQIYGLTETGNTAICLPPEAHVSGSGRLTAAGRPYPCVDVRVTDDDGRDLPPGAVGEVWLRTPAAMVEYWGKPEATASTLVDGWIRTRDAGALDEEGYLFLKDRLDDMVVVGGENVYPAEVENVIARHPAVADVAVVGVPDDATGEAVAAFVHLRDGALVTTRDLALFLRDHLAPFKLPRSYEFVPEVPRNPSGKILRRVLREPQWAGRDRMVN